jgi:uncharacterized protein YaaN involved in tellurite resistance
MDKQEMMEMMKTVLANSQEHLLANINANKAKADETRKEMLAAIKANEETTTRMDANLGSMRTELKSAIREIEFSCEETMACQGNMEARLEEDKPASVEMKPEVAEEQKVPV